MPDSDLFPAESTHQAKRSKYGTIPQAPKTYKVLGYINEKQLSITESTFGGRSGQENPDGIIHYTVLEEFDFSAAYSPANFHTQRISDARSWSIFRISSIMGEKLHF